MELSNKLTALGEKIKEYKDRIETEESTKTAFVLPFIDALGYDIFNPFEVRPEFTADIGLKKGEKVDYAILQDKKAILIIECKHWKENLDLHDSQLLRYFHVTKTRFALLTNGITYRFYSDLEEDNKMDAKPFLEFNLEKLKDLTISEIAKFHKSNFDVDLIVSNASSLKYTKEIRKLFNSELNEPSEDFVRHFASSCYSGRLTSKVLDQFKELVHIAMNQTISDRVNDRLHSALTKEAEQQLDEVVDVVEESKIITTEEELEGYRIVVAILRRHVDKSQITYRDTQSYFGILFENNNRKPICRLHLDRTNKKYIGIFDENKKEVRHPIDSVGDIYSFENDLVLSLQSYTNLD